MNSKDYFENYFLKNSKHSYSPSLKSFYDEVISPRLPSISLNVLDIGAGNYSLFEDVNRNDVVTAVDFSKNAILQSPKSKINYLEADISSPANFPESKYDLIFDSHCLNCILSDVDRDQVFQNIYNGLVIDGLFTSELMIQPTSKSVSMPFKMIKTSLEIEQEFISHGFKIIYFMISMESGFINEINGVEVKCDLLRIVAKK